MINEEKYIAMFRRCEKPKIYLKEMCHSLLDKMNFLILEMRTSETKTFRHEYINALAREILAAEDFIYVISGELSSNIWNSDMIVKAISNTKARTIKIICGPEIDLKSIEMLKLVADGKIDLYFSKKRFKKHFLLTEKRLFMEKGHRNFDFSDEILMTSKDATKIISFYKEKFEKKIEQEKQIKYVLAEKILQKFSPRVIKLGGKGNNHVSAEEILQKFSPRIFKTNVKENNMEPTQREIDDFKKELGIEN